MVNITHSVQPQWCIGNSRASIIGPTFYKYLITYGTVNAIYYLHKRFDCEYSYVIRVVATWANFCLERRLTFCSCSDMLVDGVWQDAHTLHSSLFRSVLTSAD